MFVYSKSADWVILVPLKVIVEADEATVSLVMIGSLPVNQALIFSNLQAIAPIQGFTDSLIGFRETS